MSLPGFLAKLLAGRPPLTAAPGQSSYTLEHACADCSAVRTFANLPRPTGDGIAVCVDFTCDTCGRHCGAMLLPADFDRADEAAGA